LEDFGECMLWGYSVPARVSHAPSPAEGFHRRAFPVWVFLFVCFVF